MSGMGSILGQNSHSHAPVNNNSNNSNTLPMRTSNSGHLGINGGGVGHHLSHAHSQQLPFIPQSKHTNPCQSVKTLPFGFGFSESQQKMQQQQQQGNSSPKDMQDLIHLSGPLTEHAVMRTLQARFNERRYFVSISGIRLGESLVST